MVRSLNKVMLIGNVGADPKISMTSNQNKVATFSIATTTDWKDTNGMRQSRTEWHHVVTWQWLADIVESYVKRGKQLYIEGHLQNRSYTDKNNIERQITEVVASEIILLGGGVGMNGAPQDFSGQQGDGVYGGQQQGGYSNGSYAQNNSFSSPTNLQRNSSFGNSYSQQPRGNTSYSNRTSNTFNNPNAQQQSFNNHTGTQFSGTMANPQNATQFNSQVNNGASMPNATSVGRVGNITNQAAVGATIPTIAGFASSQQSQQNFTQQSSSVNNVQNQSAFPVSSADAISGGISEKEDIPF